MPERWERELLKLRSLETDDAAVQRRASGPRPERRPPGGRIAAGVVAALVAIAGIALVWRTLPQTPAGAGAPEPLPVLSVSFHDSEVRSEGPDASYRSVQTTISYGDAVDESHTSTTPENAIVEWVRAEDLTRFVPGPTVGSSVEFHADGQDATVLLGRPNDWPNFDAMTRIDRLPDEPGEYLLVFEATYAEGIARTARVIEVVEPGVLQLVLYETTDDDAVSGDAYVDGRGVHGFLSESSLTEGDTGPLKKVPEAPTFSSEAWLEIRPGTPVVLTTAATTATSGTFDSYEAFDTQTPLPNDLVAGPSTIGGSPGRVLLAVDATWVHPAPGVGDNKTSERALFFFPVEIVPGAEVEATPSAITGPSPYATEEQPEVSPAPTNEGEVRAAPALRVRCKPFGAEVLTPVVATQVDGLHIVPVDTPRDWEIFLFPAADSRRWFAAGSDDTDDEFARPLPPGEASIACIDREAFTEADAERAHSTAQAFVLVDPSGFFTTYTLDCSRSEQQAMNWDLPGVVIDDAVERLRAIPGVRTDDVIESAGYDHEWGSVRDWRIIRDSRIIAHVSVGEQSGGWAGGWVCNDSGIRGHEL